MNLLIDDMIVHIMTYLNNKSKIQFLSISKNLQQLKNKVQYNEKISLNKIRRLPYYNMFLNVIIQDDNILNNNLCFKLPNAITHLTLDISGTCNKDYIPVTITHLTFGDHFYQDINDCIPNSVTHLEFGISFNKYTKGCIP